MLAGSGLHQKEGERLGGSTRAAEALPLDAHARCPPPHPTPHLPRAGWNALDALVVVLGYLDLTSLGNFTSIRTVRVLRPLRTINRVKGMRVGARRLVAR